MTSINLRQLRDTKTLKGLLLAGETVELRERNQVLGRIIPESVAAAEKVSAGPAEWPDFAARRKAIFGDRIIPAVDQLIEDRENSRY